MRFLEHENRLAQRRGDAEEEKILGSRRIIFIKQAGEIRLDMSDFCLPGQPRISDRLADSISSLVS